MSVPTLERWAVVKSGTPYTAPEAMTAHLTGEVYEDERFGDGKRIRTSRIVRLSVAESMATTASGTEYRLGVPSDDFLRFIAANGYSIDDYAST